MSVFRKIIAGVGLLLVMGCMTLVAGAQDAEETSVDPTRHFNLKWEQENRQLCADADFLELRAACSFVDVSNPLAVTVPIQAKYNVIKSGPWILTPPVMGYDDKGWQVIWLAENHYRRIGNGPEFDLSRTGVNHAAYLCRIPSDGVIPKGAVSIISPGVMQVRWADRGGYLRNANDTSYMRPSPPEWLGAREASSALIFTFANLTEYKIVLTDFQYDRGKGGAGRVRWMLTDADGEQFPVLNASISLWSGDYAVPLTTELQDHYQPSGWLTFALPEGACKDVLKFNGEILLAMGDGRIVRELVELEVASGQRTGSGVVPVPPPAGTLPVRALWVVANDMRDPGRVDEVVQAAAAAGINTLLGMVLVADEVLFASEIFPFKPRDEKYDPLAYLIEQGHASGLKVHAVLCVNHRRAAFRDWFKLAHQVDIGNMRHATDGQPHYQAYAICMRAEAYHDFIVKLADEVARKYQIDGMQLDYIRAKSFCQCPRCAMEFEQYFNKPIASAENEDWSAFYGPKIGKLVKRVAWAVHQHRPAAMMSVAAPASEDGKTQGQSVGDWARNYGCYVMPMSYGAQTLRMVKAFRYFAGETCDPGKIIMGLGLYSRIQDDAMPHHAGRAIFRRLPRAPDVLAEQVATMAALQCGGVSFFGSHYLTTEIAAALGRTFASADAGVSSNSSFGAESLRP